MKRTASEVHFQDLNRRVTRLQITHIKSVFPFFTLPAELRELIYLYCFTFKGIEKYFDKLYAYVNATVNQPTGMRKVARRQTPTILLINRQIFNEAVVLIRKHSISFDHGLLTTKLSRVISENPLRQVSSIEITDQGHPILEEDILNSSWHGYMRLLRSLADVLEKGHHLKSFTLRFTDPQLVEHVTKCVSGSWDCGFRDQLRDAVNCLKKVRGVQTVTLSGIEDAVAQDVKRRMESTTTTTWHDLPTYLHTKIFNYAIDWSDISSALATGLAKWQNPNDPFPYPKWSTPTVLLLNKQITRETLKMLHNKPITLNFPAEHGPDRYGSKLPRLLRFIRVPKLRWVQTLDITLEHWKWAWTMIVPVDWLLHDLNALTKISLTLKGADGKTAIIKYPRENFVSLPMHRDFKVYGKALRGFFAWGVEGEVPEGFAVPIVHMLLYSNPDKQFFRPIPPRSSAFGNLIHLDP